MSEEMLSALLTVAIAVGLLIAWLIAEFRWRTVLRVSLGLACFLFIGLQVWLTATVADQQLVLHQIGLERIERRLEDGQEPQVRHALWVYRNTLDETRSPTAAAVRMNSLLERD